MGRAAAPAQDNERAAVAAGMHHLEYQPAGVAQDRRKAKPILLARPLARFPPQAFRR
jgi:hypothetical protein